MAYALTAALPFLRAAQPEAGNEEGERTRKALDYVRADIREREAGHRFADYTAGMKRAVEMFERRLELLRAAHPEGDRAPEDPTEREVELDAAGAEVGWDGASTEADRAPSDVAREGVPDGTYGGARRVDTGTVEP